MSKRGFTMGKQTETQVSEEAMDFQTLVKSIEIGIGGSPEQPNILAINLIKPEGKGVTRKVREHIFMLIDHYCVENGIPILERIFGELEIQILLASNTTIDACKKLVQDLKLLAAEANIIINDALQLLAINKAVTT